MSDFDIEALANHAFTEVTSALGGVGAMRHRAVTAAAAVEREHPHADPFYEDDAVTLYHGDSLDVIRTLADASVDAVVTDPPYGLGFMGKAWDAEFMATTTERRRQYAGDPSGGTGTNGGYRSAAAEAGRYDLSPTGNRAFGAWCEQWSAECLRVLKPGGHMLAFGGTRTYHRLACAIEDAGFEIRDSIAWLYGSGFPKSLDVSKAIDKAAGATREVVGRYTVGGTAAMDGRQGRASVGAEGLSSAGMIRDLDVTAPATDDARTWQGWGTALKPSHEPVCVARKPYGHSDILALIGSHLDRLDAQWQAPAADPTTPTGEAVGSPDPTDTSPSGSETTTSSSTVTSWRACWVELCEATSTSTTSTTSETTTVLRTLLSSLSRLTGESTRAHGTSRPGSTSLATVVDNLFASAVFASRATLALSAADLATSSTPTSPRDATARTAFEPIVVARKPLGAGTVAANVLAHGTGALNIDGCRIDGTKASGSGQQPFSAGGIRQDNGRPAENVRRDDFDVTAGRWPANVVLDESQAAELDRQSGTLTSGVLAAHHERAPKDAGILGAYGSAEGERGYGDTGGASRFFYVAKAPTAERPREDGIAHPTVKPLDLMRWLVRLVTPPGGTVLEPFAGSGTTAEACVIEGFRCIAIEREADYLPLIVARLSKPIQPSMFGGVA